MPTDKKISEFPSAPAGKILDSNKKIISELQRVAPSSVVTLFEIDIEDLLVENLLPYDNASRSDAVFRFHNNLKLIKQDIIWKGQVYKASPIKVDGYEASSKGPTATPKLTFVSDEEDNKAFRELRTMLRQLDDLVGGKVTRLRTFAKYLDEENFYINVGGEKRLVGSESIVPEGFQPDPLAEFPREIFFIERKIGESAKGIELQLASPVDFENLSLPRRKCISRTCQFDYRGEGCLYEYSSHFGVNDSATREKSEKSFGCDNLGGVNLPTEAPPIANEKNELIKDIIPEFNPRSRPSKWSADRDYSVGSSIYYEKNNRKYYFVCKKFAEKSRIRPSTAPPNMNYWEPDICSKNIKGCKLRWG
jgi:lambda family phage minor tail protein L